MLKNFALFPKEQHRERTSPKTRTSGRNGPDPRKPKETTMRKTIHLAAAIAFLAAPFSFIPGIVVQAEAKKAAPAPKLPAPKNGVCWHWSHGKATAHPC
jgi:hypothetical protein